MPAANAINLSLLPAPDVIEVKSIATILAEIKAAFLDDLPGYDVDNPADPAVKVMEIAAMRETLIRQRINEAIKAILLPWATGADLQALGALFNLAKLDGETDDAYRERIQLAPDGFSTAGPQDAYEFHARSAHPDVADAAATSPEPCEVVIAVLSKLGDGTPTGPVLAAVTGAVNDRKVRPLADRVEVIPAEILDYAIAGTLYFYDGPDRAIVMAEALSRLTQYVAAMRKIGRDITRSGLIAALHAEGVQRVELLSPAADVVCTLTQAGYCSDIDITDGGVAE